MANDITVIREFLPPEDPQQTTLHTGTEILILGRWDGGPNGTDQPCEVVLPDPGNSVSRSHAGINKVDDQFYIINVTEKNVFRLNGRWIKPEEAGILADGDIVQIGPYIITVARKSGSLILRVLLEEQVARQRGMSGSLSASVAEIIKQQAVAPPTAAPVAKGVIDVFWERRKKREKAARPSPLHPRLQARPGKVRWNWLPTRDLARPWPFSIFIWGTIMVAAFAIITALSFASAYSPAPLSSPHQRANFALAADGKIANKLNSNSCLTCHSILGRQTVDQKCAECHQAEGFHSSNTKKHTDAGITCTTCHQEHQGADYEPKARGFASCAECHNDQNQKLYGPNKAAVETPHKDRYGYPVKFGKWTWMGLEPEVLKLKPDVIKTLARYQENNRSNTPITRQQELNWQFHYIHLERVKAAPGVEGVRDGVLSCSSCHKEVKSIDGVSPAPIDRNYPIEVCGKCHNGYYDALNKKQWVDEKRPNCTSCHVQHYDDKYRWGDLLVDKQRRQDAIDDKTVESIIKPQ